MTRNRKVLAAPSSAAMFDSQFQEQNNCSVSAAVPQDAVQLIPREKRAGAPVVPNLQLAFQEVVPDGVCALGDLVVGQWSVAQADEAVVDVSRNLKHVIPAGVPPRLHAQQLIQRQATTTLGELASRLDGPGWLRF